MAKRDLTGKTCGYIFVEDDNLESWTRRYRCSAPAFGWDKSVRGYRCRTHLTRKPHKKRQEPGSPERTRPSSIQLPDVHYNTD